LEDERAPYESFILEKYDHFKRVCDEIGTKDRGVYILCDPFSSVIADDNYNEADFLFSLMIEPNIEKKLVLMFTKVVKGERVFISDLDEKDYCSVIRSFC